MKSSEIESHQIMIRCPKFQNCSAPVCPLDLLQDYRTALRGEPKCTLKKSRRLKIAKETKLERQGFTRTEWAAKKRWEGLSESEIKRRMAKLRPFRSNLTGVFARNEDS